MKNSNQWVVDRLKLIPDVDSQVAIFKRQSSDGVRVLVQFGEGDPVDIPSSGQYLPWPDDPVQIESRNGSLVMTGPAVAKPVEGVISAAGSPKATVTVGGKDYLMQLRDGYTAVVGDPVTVNWVTRLIEGKVTAPSVPPSGSPGSSGPPPGAFELVFQAQDSGSWNGSRYYLNDVQASDSIMGAWWYGNAIFDTLNGANVTSVEIYLPLIQELGVATIGRHGYGVNTGVWVGQVDGVALAPRNGWVPLPLSYADLTTGVSGISVTSGNGLNRWKGVQADGLSGAIRIRGTK